MKEIKLPIQCVIPIPVAAPRARGKASVASLEVNLKVRVSTSDNAAIEEIAKELGMTVASFMRHCAVHTALFIRRYRNDQGNGGNLR